MRCTLVVAVHAKFASVVILLLAIGMLSPPFRAVSNAVDQSIHIRSDGLVYPPIAAIATADNETYTLTGDVNSPITVERDNIVIDGNGHAIQGTGGYGSNGINLNGRSNITIKNTQITEFWQGISIVASSNINVSSNLITYHYDGIVITTSFNDTIAENTITSNYDDAIYFEGCANNSIHGNQIVGSELTNHDYGITFYNSPSNTASDNNISRIEYGIGIQDSSNNKIRRNEISKTDQYALWLSQATNNTLWENNVTDNFIGVWLSSSANNAFFRNNFINNSLQVQTENAVNLWNDAYASGGNYWSDYNGKDSNSGEYQNQTGSDGIGDTPYFINPSNQDHYPFVNAIPEYSSPIVIALLITTTLLWAITKRKTTKETKTRNQVRIVCQSLKGKI